LTVVELLKSCWIFCAVISLRRDRSVLTWNVDKTRKGEKAVKSKRKEKKRKECTILVLFIVPFKKEKSDCIIFGVCSRGKRETANMTSTRNRLNLVEKLSTCGSRNIAAVAFFVANRHNFFFLFYRIWY
jgi:hypothetical protein